MTERIQQMIEDISKGRRLKREDDLEFLLTEPIDSLCEGADRIREELCGNQVDLCSIINGRSGKCSEDCKFCAQSGHHCTDVETYGFLSAETVLEDCRAHEAEGVHRYSIVTAGRTLCGEDLEKAEAIYQTLSKECQIRLCASHGLLSTDAFRRLKEAGVERYHANIETSERNFEKICTTHTYEDKIACIKRAQEVGLEVCSGGIIGLGETWEDRMDMAFSLAELNITSIPLNVLIPIEGTPFGHLKQLSEEEILRTICIFRYLNPNASVRLAAGRTLLDGSGKKAFQSGANATITGNMLTTSGNNIKEDKEMLGKLGFAY